MPQPTESAIRARAYDLWERNGRPDGRDIDYWLQAARELEEEDRLAEGGKARPAPDGLDASPPAGDGTKPAPPADGRDDVLGAVDERPAKPAAGAPGPKSAPVLPRSAKEKRGDTGRLRA